MREKTNMKEATNGVRGSWGGQEQERKLERDERRGEKKKVCEKQEEKGGEMNADSQVSKWKKGGTNSTDEWMDG